MASYGFHSEAAEEYLAATQHYLEHASPFVATAFVAEVKPLFKRCLTLPRDGQQLKARRYGVTSSPDFHILFTIVGTWRQIAFRSTL